MADGEYTEEDPKMHELYERAQCGQLTYAALNQLSDDELFYLCGHEPDVYFDTDRNGATERRDRQSKLTHNVNRAQLLLQRRWVERSETANRGTAQSGVDAANAAVKFSKRLVWATYALVAATLVLVGVGFYQARHQPITVNYVVPAQLSPSPTDGG